MTRTRLTDAELDSLKLRATSGAPTCAVRAEQLAELVEGYREDVIDFGEIKEPGGDAFLGGMLGSFAGSMLERRLREFQPPPAAQKKGKRSRRVKAK